MSEETKAKVVEEENPSAAEKETKVLKKMGLDTGTETVTKVDLRKPKEEKDAIQEQSTDEVLVRDESSASEEVQEKNETQPEEPAAESQEKEEAIIEQVEESEQTKKEPIKEEPIVQEANTVEQPEVNVPEATGKAEDLGSFEIKSNIISEEEDLSSSDTHSPESSDESVSQPSSPRWRWPWSKPAL